MNPEHLSELLNNVLNTYPDLEYFNLASHTLDTTNIDALVVFLQSASKLKTLDISNNVFSSHAIAFLHYEINIINNERDDASQLALISDYSLWNNSNPSDEHTFYQWALTPKQWKSEENHEALFSGISRCLYEDPETFQQFLFAFEDDYTQKDPMGNIPFIYTITLHANVLTRKLIAHLGLDTYIEKLTRAYDKSNIEKLPVHDIMYFIEFISLSPSTNIALASRLIDELLPDNCPERLYLLGKISSSENDPLKAFEFFSQAARNAEGRTLGLCYYWFAYIMQAHLLPDKIPYDRERLKFYLKYCSDNMMLEPIVEYGLLLEEENSLASAFTYYEEANHHIQNSPYIASMMGQNALQELNKRINFLFYIQDLCKKLLDIRVELAQARFQHTNYASRQIFNGELLRNSLETTLLQPSISILLYDKQLLQLCVSDPTAIEQLSSFLYQQMRISTTPNHELLSMAPEDYSNSLRTMAMLFIERKYIAPLKTGLDKIRCAI